MKYKYVLKLEGEYSNSENERDVAEYDMPEEAVKAGLFYINEANELFGDTNSNWMLLESDLKEGKLVAKRDMPDSSPCIYLRVVKIKKENYIDDMENAVDDVGVIFESDAKEKLGVEDLFGNQSTGDIATLNRKNPKGIYYYREASLNKKSTGLTSPISYIDRPPDLEEPFVYNEDEDFLRPSEDGEELPGNKSDLNEKTETFYELEDFMNKISNIKNYYNIVKKAGRFDYPVDKNGEEILELAPDQSSYKNVDISDWLKTSGFSGGPSALLNKNSRNFHSSLSKKTVTQNFHQVVGFSNGRPLTSTFQGEINPYFDAYIKMMTKRVGSNVTSTTLFIASIEWAERTRGSLGDFSKELFAEFQRWEKRQSPMARKDKRYKGIRDQAFFTTRDFKNIMVKLGKGGSSLKDVPDSGVIAAWYYANRGNLDWKTGNLIDMDKSTAKFKKGDSIYLYTPSNSSQEEKETSSETDSAEVENDIEIDDFNKLSESDKTKLFSKAKADGKLYSMGLRLDPEAGNFILGGDPESGGLITVEVHCEGIPDVSSNLFNKYDFKLAFDPPRLPKKSAAIKILDKIYADILDKWTPGEDKDGYSQNQIVTSTTQEVSGGITYNNKITATSNMGQFDTGKKVDTFDKSIFKKEDPEEKSKERRERSRVDSSSNTNSSSEAKTLSSYFQEQDVLEKGSGLKSKNKSHLKDAVKELQTRLQNLSKTDLGEKYAVHYQSYITRLLGDDPNDGLYWSDVQDTVEAYQKAVNKHLKKNLREDGIVDKATYESLFGGKVNLSSMLGQKGDRVSISNNFSKKQPKPKKEEKRKSVFGPVSGVPSFGPTPPSLTGQPLPQAGSNYGAFGPLGSTPPKLPPARSSVKDYYNIVKTANNPEANKDQPKSDAQQAVDQADLWKQYVIKDDTLITDDQIKQGISTNASLRTHLFNTLGGTVGDLSSYAYLSNDYSKETKQRLSDEEIDKVFLEGLPPKAFAKAYIEKSSNEKVKEAVKFHLENYDKTTNSKDNLNAFHKRVTRAMMEWSREEKAKRGPTREEQQQAYIEEALPGKSVTDYITRKIFDGIYTDKSIKVNEVLNPDKSLKEEFITKLIKDNAGDIYGQKGVQKAYQTQAKDGEEIDVFEEYVESILDKQKLQSFLSQTFSEAKPTPELTPDEKTVEQLVRENKIVKGYGKTASGWDDEKEKHVRLIQQKMIKLEDTAIEPLLNEGITIAQLQEKVNAELGTGSVATDGQYFDGVEKALKEIYDNTSLEGDGKSVTIELFNALFGTTETEVAAAIPDESRIIEKAHIYRESKFRSRLYFEDNYGGVFVVVVSTPNAEDITAALNSASDLIGKSIGNVKNVVFADYPQEDFNLGNEKLKENKQFLETSSSSNFILSQVIDIDETAKAYQIPDKSTLDSISGKGTAKIPGGSEAAEKTEEEGQATTISPDDKAKEDTTAKSIIIDPKAEGRTFEEASLLWSIINKIREGSLDVRVAKDNNKNIIKLSKKNMRKAFLEALVYENEFKEYIVKTNNSVKLSNMKDGYFKKMALTSSRMDVQQMKQTTEESLNYIHTWLKTNKPAYNALKPQDQGEAIATAIWNFYKDNIRQIGGEARTVNTDYAAYYYMAITEMVNYLKGGLVGSTISKYRGGARDKVENKTVQFGKFTAKYYPKDFDKYYDESVIVDWGRSMYYLWNYITNQASQDTDLKIFKQLLATRYISDQRLWNVLKINKKKYDSQLSKNPKNSIYKNLLNETKKKTQKAFDAVTRRSSR